MKKGSFKKLVESFTFAMVVACTMGAAISEAAPYITRAHCNRPGGQGWRGKQMGERNAKRLVDSVFARLGRTCDQVDRVAQIISDTPFAASMSGGEFGACFYQGYVEKMWDALDDIYLSCGNACFGAGLEVGNISAQGYCAASVAVGGLLDPGFIGQPALPFCGQNLVMGCKAQYVQTATSEFPGCYQFTVGHFANTFDNSVRQDCFVPSDVPIRDGRYSSYTQSTEDFLW